MANSNREPLIQNRILAALPGPELQCVLSSLEPVSLAVKEVLTEPHTPIPFVYFPEEGLITKVVTTEDGSCVEVGMTGREGMTGICLYLGNGNTAPFRSIVQIPGKAYRIKTKTFEDEIRGNDVWADLLRAHAHTVLVMISQVAACNLLHDAQQRCCRWLLMARDRVGTDEFVLTQESLALMLGVRRQSITKIASSLSRKGLISYRWGKLTILDRPGLEMFSCGCYQVIRRYGMG